MWICPVCKASLVLSGKQWQCENRHSYDSAKSGYVNLLLANQKNRPEPGDNKEMLSARRAFLEAGHFHSLVESLVETLLEKQAAFISQPSQQQPLVLHDLGCGEGYYLAGISALLHESGVAVSGTGNDISRTAIDMAARKYPELQFAVAGNFKIPVASNSQNVLLQIFAPASAGEVHRILSTGGLWVQVTPGPDHLSRLRAALYEKPSTHDTNTAIPEGFELLHETGLQFDLHLPDLEIRKALLTMTPYYWRVKQDAMDSVLEEMVELCADFSIRVLKKQ